MLARISHLRLKARVLTDALLMGEHRSRRVGAAVEFADFQDYVPGMDLRFLDWRVLARSDRLVVKRFETETECPCTVVLDLSGDLLSGDGEYPDLDGSKAGWAISAAATLITLLSRQGEPIGLEIVGGLDAAHRSLPPRGGPSHRHLLIATLAQLRPGGQAGLRAALTRVGRRLRRRSWVALITDGMEEPTDWLPSLGALARRGVDLRLMHLCDTQELTLGSEGAAVFFSPEGGAPLALDPSAVREPFKAIVNTYLAQIYQGVLRWGGRYSLARVDGPLERALSQLLSAEQRPLEQLWP